MHASYLQLCLFTFIISSILLKTISSMWKFVFIYNVACHLSLFGAQIFLYCIIRWHRWKAIFIRGWGKTSAERDGNYVNILLTFKNRIWDVFFFFFFLKSGVLGENIEMNKITTGWFFFYDRSWRQFKEIKSFFLHQMKGKKFRRYLCDLININLVKKKKD